MGTAIRTMLLHLRESIVNVWPLMTVAMGASLMVVVVLVAAGGDWGPSRAEVCVGT